MYFDDQLAVPLLAALCRQLPHDRIEIGSQVNSGIHRTWKTLSEWHSYYRNLAEDEREPFDDVKLFVGNTLTGFVQTDNWTACGGPHPYHDTWTFSVYLASYDRESLQGILLATCVEHDAFVRDILSGVEEPSISLTSRVWSWMR